MNWENIQLAIDARVFNLLYSDCSTAKLVNNLSILMHSGLLDELLRCPIQQLTVDADH